MKKLLLGTLFLALTQTAVAGKKEFQAEADKMCEKMKACAKAEMGDMSEIPPEMRGFIESALDQACASINIYQQTAMLDKSLIDAGTACMESMNKMSCDELQNAGDSFSPECDKFEKMGEKFGEKFAQ